MSARKLKPSSSRRWMQASTIRAGSTTSVVSPCASRVSTSPGTAAYHGVILPDALVDYPATPRISYAGGMPALIRSCSRTMPSISASGRGGQPGTYMSTGMILSTPCSTA